MTSYFSDAASDDIIRFCRHAAVDARPCWVSHDRECGGWRRMRMRGAGVRRRRGDQVTDAAAVVAVTSAASTGDGAPASERTSHERQKRERKMDIFQ